MQRDAVMAPQATTRVAYLTNAYPRPSHSFIRREIEALERQGIDVRRWSIRPVEGELPDSGDQRELTRTHIIFDGNYGALLGAVVATAVERPLRLLRALGCAWSMCTRGLADVPRHLAYVVEACRIDRDLVAAGINHVHVHFGTNPAAVARLCSKLGRVTYSMTVHGPDEFDAPIALSLKGKAADAKLVVAVSHFGRGQLMRWLRPDDWSKIAVVRCGVDAAFRDRKSGVVASNRLVCVARLSAQKGLPILLDAVRLVADTRDFELRIIGSGELREQLEARIVALDLSRHVVLLGTRSADGVRRELLAARALVLASFAEGLPVVLMEALGLGRPVIATAIAGIPELVDESCGWLVPSGSVTDLAEAIHSALDADPATLQAMGDAGRARVTDDHDVDVNTAQLARLLRPLARQPVAA